MHFYNYSVMPSTSDGKRKRKMYLGNKKNSEYLLIDRDACSPDWVHIKSKLLYSESSR